MRIADGLRIKPGDVVTLIGGGGKTTVMFRLAEELTAAGLTVISTMTTKIFVGQMERARQACSWKTARSRTGSRRCWHSTGTC